ncbi:magnesium transporter CorA family protein [Enterococcus sp. LJL99]
MINYFKESNNIFLSEPSNSKEVVWISVNAPTAEEISQLIDQYQLPSDYITAILDDNENARFEGSYQQSPEKPILLLLQYPKKVESPSGYLQFDTFPFAVILTIDKKIITISKEIPPFIQQMDDCTRSPEEFSVQEELILKLSWHISHAYNHYLNQLIKKTNQLEGELQVSTENNQLYQIMDIQKSLVYFESALTANLAVWNLLYPEATETQPTHKSKLHDILVETKQALATSKVQLQLVDKISDTFSAIVSNNLNNVMKILTSLTIVLTIPTIIGGLFGMNVKLPFSNREDAFWWIFIITLGLCIFVIRKLKKRNLL